MPAPAVNADTTAPGFYGKLPVRGDFIGRRLDRRFIDPWDSWLQEAILASRDELGERWLGLYLNSPIWRFALSAGACGPEVIAGVTIPSIDSVGRYFPLMIGSELGVDVDLTALVTQSDGWYCAVEALILSTLEPGFTLDLLEAPLSEEPSCASGGPGGDVIIPPPGLYFPTGTGERANPVALDLLRQARQPVSIWWTEGSEHVMPCCLVSAGLPAPHSFASMLDGGWEDRGWKAAKPDLDASALSDQQE